MSNLDGRKVRQSDVDRWNAFYRRFKGTHSRWSHGLAVLGMELVKKASAPLMANGYCSWGTDGASSSMRGGALQSDLGCR